MRRRGATTQQDQQDKETQLIEIAGIGPRKLALYGEAVLALVKGASVDDLVPVPTPKKISTTES